MAKKDDWVFKINDSWELVLGEDGYTLYENWKEIAKARDEDEVIELMQSHGIEDDFNKNVDKLIRILLGVFRSSY